MVTLESKSHSGKRMINFSILIDRTLKNGLWVDLEEASQRQSVSPSYIFIIIGADGSIYFYVWVDGSMG